MAAFELTPEMVADEMRRTTGSDLWAVSLPDESELCDRRSIVGAFASYLLENVADDPDTDTLGDWQTIMDEFRHIAYAVDRLRVAAGGKDYG